jgi:hypothetical protein
MCEENKESDVASCRSEVEGFEILRVKDDMLSRSSVSDEFEFIVHGFEGGESIPKSLRPLLLSGVLFSVQKSGCQCTLYHTKHLPS